MLFENEEGFSIVEVVVAATLILLIAITVLPGFIFSSETSSNANLKVIATSLARREAEQVKTLGGEATTDPYHQLSDAPKFGLERIVTTDSPQVGMNTVQINVCKHPKDSQKPLATFTFYILQKSGGI
jgi:type II secretory pathway pseudopilin PulG